MACEIQYQKLIAYAILGYIDFIRTRRIEDIAINTVFGPSGGIDGLYGDILDESIISALHQIDEIDVLMKLGGPDEFEKGVAGIVDPILLFLSESSVKAWSGTYAIQQLCCDDR